jgi:2-polyprenyl-3-methyl-5-hydroxy-6-metoxy-1,4-benzoquinol methylase
LSGDGFGCDEGIEWVCYSVTRITFILADGFSMSSPPVGDPFIHPLEDSAFLMALLGQITGEPAQQVRERWIREHRRVGTNVGEAVDKCGLVPHVWCPQMDEFYAQTDAFLYESATWNRTPLKNAMRRWIAEYLQRTMGSGARLLMFGDGLGFDSAYLALAGHDVTYCEPGRMNQAFARAIFAANKAEVRVLDSVEGIARGAFDAVICLDVLEHVPDPPGLAGMLAGALRDGGRLIVHAPFYYLTARTKTHLRTNRVFSGNVSRIYAPHGLRLVDGRFFWDPIVLEKVPAGATPAPRAWWRMAMLRFSGALLAVGRYWAWPHCWLAQQLCRVDDKHQPG